MEQGWSMKKLHKLIMLSRVYAESSYTIKAQEDIDPDNRYLWRANVRRLDFEAFRDSLLVMSGRLDNTLGGQPVNLTDEPYSYRRSVYGYVDRGDLPELMQNFDFSNPDMPNSSRTSTIVPQQALFLMNSPMAIDVARRVTARPGGQSVRRRRRLQEDHDDLRDRLRPRSAARRDLAWATKFISAEIRKQAETVAAMKDGDRQVRGQRRQARREPREHEQRDQGDPEHRRRDRAQAAHPVGDLRANAPALERSGLRKLRPTAQAYRKGAAGNGSALFRVWRGGAGEACIASHHSSSLPTASMQRSKPQTTGSVARVARHFGEGIGSK